ncbi:2OG-Fe(II) oxygenase superfamily protein [Metarhizium robertsii]|uniref:Oxoglutarate/iron-dependent oxygenase n=2 Tax=Metarhizium robertsii TaxID=568076 RepID=E9FE32_METRA|nr:Oxoglutarate/iron-dependent oxygenase [Metarhizium robertsii ARSEF 23]EFY94008.1 Oxoglutarate/iron-dependent oxygenase [Metarhizium robertsii ARSEF 23]EXU94775.1 2OG-Fe(II) oxygenase superfamily protein [Metarhizium robertsii]
MCSRTTILLSSFLTMLLAALAGKSSINPLLQGLDTMWNGAAQTSITQVLDCTHTYSIEIMSVDPLVLYINDFLKMSEIDYLVEKYYRSSQSAHVPPSDPVSKCLHDRMKSLLGNIQHIDVESLQLVSYSADEQFRYHFDWFHMMANETGLPHNPHRQYNRLGSIFAYLGDDCTGGETYFPDVMGVSSIADEGKFSRTDDPSGKGLLVKPKKGNALFWNNMQSNGTGDRRLLHAGLPVHSGVKIGLNMFSFYYPDTPIIGGDIAAMEKTSDESH